jgi:hypothetical protein
MEIHCDEYTGNTVRTGEFFIRTEGLRKKITVRQIPLSQPNPTSPTNICPNEANTIFLAVATGVAGITYRWEMSTNGTAWTPAPTPNDAQDYTIAANTLTVDTYFRRVAIWNGFETATSPVQVLMPPPLRTDIPDFVIIGSGADLRRWHTRNLDAPGVFAAHSSSLGRFYQWGTISSVTNHWDAINPGASVAISDWSSSNTRAAWTTTQEPCILARSGSSLDWRLPVGSGNAASDEFLMLLNASSNGSQWITHAQAGQLGLGCIPGRLFGPGVNAVIVDGNAVPTAFNPTTMLFLPAAGWRNYTNGALSSPGVWGLYWSSTAQGPDPGSSFAWSLQFISDNAYVNTNVRANGFSVRCISE